MSLFKTKDQTPPDPWKDKYYALLDSQDEIEKSYQDNQDLLCKTIVRFAIAIKGLNKQLDPHLSRIREVLKSGVKHQALYEGLQAFSDALMSLEESSQRPDTSILFDYLEQYYPELKRQLYELQDQYEQGLLASLADVYQSLLELTQPLGQGQVVVISEAAPKRTDHAIQQQLVALLDSLEFSELFMEQVGQLKTQMLDDLNVAAAIEAITGLLIAVKKQQDSEQREMTEFLAKLTDQLAEMGLATLNLNSASEAAQDRLYALDSDLTSQLADLQSKSALATQLEPLKQLISNRLDSVNQQIKSFTQQNRLERDQYHQQLQSLTQKVQDLEAESGELKTRLTAAQFRALRDPLTGLPNRLAYDERIKVELARCKRSGTPLTMAIWDIDYFKQINDQYGHKSGDKALIIIARLLGKQGRTTDFVARFGGEEFVMLLPETDVQAALAVVEKLRLSIGSSSFNANGDKISITLSCGLSEAMTGDDANRLFKRADEALYHAKQNGRNQCAVA